MTDWTAADTDEPVAVDTSALSRVMDLGVTARLAPQIVVTCDGAWCAHATDADHAERLRVMLDQSCGMAAHRVEVWTKIDADEAMAADRPRCPAHGVADDCQQVACSRCGRPTVDHSARPVCGRCRLEAEGT